MKSQKGFTAVEGLIIALVVIALAIGGWFVWQKQNDKSDKNGPQNGQVQENKPADQPAQLDYSVIDTVYSNVPRDLQQAILAEMEKQIPDCVTIATEDKGMGNRRVTYQPAGYAITPISCGEGGFSAFFAKDDSGVWKFVQGTQDYFDCSVIVARLESAPLFEAVLTAPARCFDGSEVVEIASLAP